MTKFFAITILATFAHMASAAPVVFNVYFVFEFDNEPESPAVVTGTITADPASDSVIDTDLILLGSLHTPDWPKNARFESIGDGWSVTDIELSLHQDASNSEWRFRAYFSCHTGGCWGHSTFTPWHDYYFELFPEDYSDEFQATLTESPSGFCCSGGEELVAAHSDSSSRGRHAHLRLPMNSSGTEFLVGTAVPEPSSLGLLLLGIVSTCCSA